MDSEARRNEILMPALSGEKTGMYKAFKDFALGGVFELNGIQLDMLNKDSISKKGMKDLYTAMDIYRDKRFETFRYIFVDKQDGKHTYKNQHIPYLNI